MASNKADRPLTPRQERFIREYLVDWNATQAAIRAGYAPKWADRIGSALLGKDRVAEALAREKARVLGVAGVTPERVLIELGKIAFARLGDYVEWGQREGERWGRLRLKDSRDVDTSPVQMVKQRAGEFGPSYEIKLHGKVEALRILARYAGLIDEHGEGARDVEVIVRPVQYFEDGLERLAPEGWQDAPVEGDYPPLPASGETTGGSDV